MFLPIPLQFLERSVGEGGEREIQSGIAIVRVRLNRGIGKEGCWLAAAMILCVPLTGLLLLPFVKAKNVFLFVAHLNTAIVMSLNRHITEYSLSSTTRVHYSLTFNNV